MIFCPQKGMKDGRKWDMLSQCSKSPAFLPQSLSSCSLHFNTSFETFLPARTSCHWGCRKPPRTHNWCCTTSRKQTPPGWTWCLEGKGSCPDGHQSDNNDKPRMKFPVKYKSARIPCLQYSTIEPSWPPSLYSTCCPDKSFWKVIPKRGTHKSPNTR